MTKTTEIHVPEWPDLTAATTKQISSWLRGLTSRWVSDLPRGTVRCRGSYQARISIAGQLHYICNTQDSAVAAHYAAVVRTLWAAKLKAEAQRRGIIDDNGRRTA